MRVLPRWSAMPLLLGCLAPSVSASAPGVRSGSVLWPPLSRAVVRTVANPRRERRIVVGLGSESHRAILRNGGPISSWLTRLNPVAWMQMRMFPETPRDYGLLDPNGQQVRIPLYGGGDDFPADADSRLRGPAAALPFNFPTGRELHRIFRLQNPDLPVPVMRAPLRYVNEAPPFDLVKFYNFTPLLQEELDEIKTQLQSGLFVYRSVGPIDGDWNAIARSIID